MRELSLRSGGSPSLKKSKNVKIQLVMSQVVWEQLVSLLASISWHHSQDGFLGKKNRIPKAEHPETPQKTGRATQPCKGGRLRNRTVVKRLVDKSW